MSKIKILLILDPSESEFNEFKPRLKSPKKNVFNLAQA